MRELLEQLGPRDVLLLAVVVAAIVALVVIAWCWPDTPKIGGVLKRRLAIATRRVPRARRDVFARSGNDGWGVPPYDWRRRPAARVDLGLTTKK